MQIRIKSTLVLYVTAILFLCSCGSKTNKEGRYIPANASFVLHMNGQSLNAKLPWEEIKQSELFKQAYADSTIPVIMKSVLDNPENTGIDVKNDMLVFVINDSSGGYIAIEGTVKDAAKFKQFSKNINETPSAESEKDGIHFLSNDNVTASWKEEKFVMVMNAGDLNNPNKMKGLYADSSVMKPVIKKDLNAIATQIFNLKESNSLGKEEKFTELMKTSGDVHFWMNLETLGLNNSDLPGMAALSMINLKKIYEGSRVTGTVNFDNGKINVDFISYSGKEMTELMNKYSGESINSDMLNRIPSKNLAFLFALNFKPDGIKEYLKLLGIDGFANIGTTIFGFNLDDFTKANKGDILLAVSDLVQDSSGKPEFSAIFSASIGDKASFDKLIQAGKKLSKEKFYTDSTPSIFYNMNEKYFAIGNKKQDIDKYTAVANNSNKELFDRFSGSSSGAYINFQYILKSMNNASKRDSLENVIYESSVKMWDDLIFKSTGLKNGGNSMHVEINLVDKNTNSLKQLNKYMSNLKALQMIQRNKPRNYSVDVTDEVESLNTN